MRTIPDHIYIWTETLAAADALVDLGFVEGSSRYHAGQGTRNRKFYWDNFFLEVLAVADPQAFASTGVLFSHAQSSIHGPGSPFGICFREDQLPADSLPNAQSYAPAYLNPGQRFYMVHRPEMVHAPLLVHVPFRKPDHAHEPRQHAIGQRRVCGINLLGEPTHIQAVTDFERLGIVVRSAPKPGVRIHLAVDASQLVEVPGLPVTFCY